MLRPRPWRSGRRWWTEGRKSLCRCCCCCCAELLLWRRRALLGIADRRGSWRTSLVPGVPASCPSPAAAAACLHISFRARVESGSSAPELARRPGHMAEDARAWLPGQDRPVAPVVRVGLCYPARSPVPTCRTRQSRRRTSALHPWGTRDQHPCLLPPAPASRPRRGLQVRETGLSSPSPGLLDPWTRSRRAPVSCGWSLLE